MRYLLLLLTLAACADPAKDCGLACDNWATACAPDGSPTPDPTECVRLCDRATSGAIECKVWFDTCETQVAYDCTVLLPPTRHPK